MTDEAVVSMSATTGITVLMISCIIPSLLPMKDSTSRQLQADAVEDDLEHRGPGWK